MRWVVVREVWVVGWDMREQFNENVLYFDCGGDWTKGVDVILCKLCLNKPEFKSNQIKKHIMYHFVVVVQSLSCVWLFVTPWTAAHQASLSFPISRSLLKLMSIKSVMLSNHLVLCCPLLLPPSIFPNIKVFSNEPALRIKWPKYCSFSNSASNDYSELISFRIDWFDLLAVQVTL